MPDTVLDQHEADQGISDIDLLDTAFNISAEVALRPEPFGALAYHYGNRRLVFLRHPDLLEVVNHLGDHRNLRSCLEQCGIAPERWPSFCSAVESLIAADMLHPRVEVI